MPKATELPINTLVIIVMAVIILLSLIAMYFTGYGPFSKTVGIEGIRGDVCRRLVQENRCTVSTNTIVISNFDANRNNLLASADTGTGWIWGTSACGSAPPAVDAGGDNLAAFCQCYYSLDSESSCRSLCECAGGSGGGGGGPGPGPGPCVPNCGGKVCGPDGCGNPNGCGVCAGGFNCNAAGQCVAVAVCSWVHGGGFCGECFRVGFPGNGQWSTCTCVAPGMCTDVDGTPLPQGSVSCIVPCPP